MAFDATRNQYAPAASIADAAGPSAVTSSAPTALTASAPAGTAATDTAPFGFAQAQADALVAAVIALIADMVALRATVAAAVVDVTALRATAAANVTKLNLVITALEAAGVTVTV